MYQNKKVGGRSGCATLFYTTEQLNVVAHLSSVCDSQAVQGPYGHMNYLLPLQSFNHLGFAYVNICAMTQSEVISLTPAQCNSSMLKSFTEERSIFLTQSWTVP